MRIRLTSWLLALLALASPVARSAPADAPDRYAARWPLELPADAGVVRLALPAEVLTQVQTADLRDLRVFNASGQAVPLALAPTRPELSTPTAVELPALPIRAASREGPVSRSTMSLRIDEGPAGRVVRLNSASTGSAGDQAPAAEDLLLGMLVDTRAQEQPLAEIELDARWPDARPFTFRIDTSTDLRQWQPLAQATAYRAPDGEVLAPARARLNHAVLKSRYLRITWDAAPTPDAVALRAVRLLPATTSAAAARVAVPLTLPETRRRDPHALEWRLPFATPLAALELRLNEAPALVPVRVLARQQREQAWTLLARHVAFQLPHDGQAQYSPPLELRQGAWRDWRIEADPATPGFTTPPQVIAWLESRQLVFVASGPPPFTLAAGRPDATRALLPLTSLMPGYQAGQEDRLPAARLAPGTSPAASETPHAVATVSADAAPDLRRWTLWAILAAGVLALAAMAWALVRQLDRPAPDSGADA